MMNVYWRLHLNDKEIKEFISKITFEDDKQDPQKLFIQVNVYEWFQERLWSGYV